MPIQASVQTRGGEVFARRHASSMTNPACLARRLCKRCPNKPGYTIHRHVVLENGRTKAAQVYPQKLCREMCMGTKGQIEADTRGQLVLAGVSVDPQMTPKKSMIRRTRSRNNIKLEEDDENQMQHASDDVSGAALGPKEVRKARADEIVYVRKMNVYDKMPTGERRRETGKGPSTVMWIHVNKGDTIQPDYRTRLVAREINIYKGRDLFAATPPLEALKVI